LRRGPRRLGGKYSRTISVDHHVKQKISSRVGRRTRRPSNRFQLSVLRATTSLLRSSFEYNRVYANYGSGIFYQERDTVHFARSILNKPFIQRIQNALRDNICSSQTSLGLPRRILIESASCITTIRNDSSQHVTVVVYEVVPRQDVIRFAPSGVTVDLNVYFDGENTSALFVDRGTSNLPPFINGAGSTPLPPIPVNTAPGNPDSSSDAIGNNTIIPSNQHLPVNYGPFDCPKLVALYKFSRPKTITLAPNGTCTLNLTRRSPRFFNGNRYFGDWNPYDYRGLTRCHFVRVIPEVHQEAPTEFEPIPLVLDPMSISVSSKYSFAARVPYENRDIIARGEITHVAPGLAVVPDGTTTDATHALEWTAAQAQGTVTLYANS